MLAPASSSIDNAPFHRFVDRSFLIIALFGVWPLLRALGATSRREVGLVSPTGQWKKLGGGLLLGFGSLMLVAVLAVGCHDREWVSNLPAHKITGTLLSAIGTAVSVAFLEEILFRGGVFGGLRRILHWTVALAISSAIYAIVHFLQRSELTGPVEWDSGLILLPQMLAGFADIHQLVPGFFNLTLAGILLGLAYHRTGNLYFSMGLHAGWIFCLKTYATFTAAVAPGFSWFWGTGKLIDGWMAFLVLFLALVLFKFLPLAPAQSPETRA